MAIGNQTTEASLNQTLGQLAVQVRNDMQQILNFWATINLLGVTGLEGLGFTTTDAQNFFNVANYLQTVAGVFEGTVAQSPAFDFDSAIAPAYGGA